MRNAEEAYAAHPAAELQRLREGRRVPLPRVFERDGRSAGGATPALARAARGALLPENMGPGLGLASREEMVQLGLSVGEVWDDGTLQVGSGDFEKTDRDFGHDFGFDDDEEDNYAGRENKRLNKSSNSSTSATRKGKKKKKKKRKQQQQVKEKANSLLLHKDDRALASFQDVVFPALRSVLWDRTPVSETYVLGAEAHVPKINFRRAALASLYNHIVGELKYFSDDEENFSTLNEDYPDGERVPVLGGFAMEANNGADIGEWVGGGWVAGIDDFSLGHPRSRRDQLHSFCMIAKPSAREIDQARKLIAMAGYKDVFVHRSERSLDSTMSFDSEDYEAILRKVMESFDIKGPADPMQYVNAYAKCKALPGNRLVMRVEMVIPALTLNFTAVKPLVILHTPLAREMERWASLKSKGVDPTDPTASGFITLNQTRNAVFLLEDDALAYEVPVVGVWLRGSALPAQNIVKDQCSEVLQPSTSWQAMLNDPLLWSVCLRYISNKRLTEKVSVSENTFVVALYPIGNSTPQFLECKYSSCQGQDDLKEMGIQPRPFLQVECAFEVDVSQRNTFEFPEGDGHAADAVDAFFYHVENLGRREAFNNAWTRVSQTKAGDWEARIDIEVEKRPPQGEASLSDESNFQDRQPPQSPFRFEEGNRHHQPLLSTIYGNNTTFGAASPAPANYNDTSKRSGRESRNESQSYLGSSFDTSGFPSPFKPSSTTARPPPPPSSMHGRSTTKSSSRKSRSRSRYHYDLLSAQQQQIAVMQNQINALQKLMEEQMRINSMRTRAVSDVALQPLQASSTNTTPPPPEKSQESHQTQVSVEQTTAVYLAGLEGDDEKVYAGSKSDDDEVDDENERVAPEVLRTENEGVEEADEKESAEAPLEEEAHEDFKERSAASIAAERCLRKRREVRSQASAKASKCGEHASGISETFLQIPSQDDSEPPSLVLPPDESAAVEGADSRPVSTHESFSNIYNEMNTQFGIPMIHDRFSQVHDGGSSENGSEDEDDPWLAEIEAKYLQRARNQEQLSRSRSRKP